MDSQNKLELSGKLNRHSIAELMTEIAHARLNGTLRAENGEQKIAVYFDAGELVFIASNARRHRLFEMLLRSRKITPPQLAAFKEVANDVKLGENLINAGILSKEELAEAFRRQFSLVLREVINWSDGEWFFSPLVRIREDARQTFDFWQLFFEYGRNLSGTQAAQRLRSFQEVFRIKTLNSSGSELLPQEAFILSRFTGEPLSADNMRDLSGLSESETFRLLYALWLGGFLERKNWNAAFTEEKLEEIAHAKLKLKETAPKEEKAPAKRTFNLSKPQEKLETPTQTQNQFSLDDYLRQVQEAEDLYETLGVGPEASTEQIKNEYFSLAKRFHPDLFYKKVEPDKHKKIQQAFTEIAHAYETLRSKDSREVYDYKMRRNLEFKKQSEQTFPTTGDAREHLRAEAAEFFESGFTLVVDEEYERALPYLARATTMVSDNARYRAYHGKALAGVGKHHQAEAELQAAIKLDPENADYRLILVKLFIEIGLFRRAEGELNRLLSVAPDNYEAKTLLDGLNVK